MKQNLFQGFNIIELVVVIVIVGVLSVFAIPLWTNSTVNLAAQADQLLADIIYAQNLAMNTGQRYQVICLSIPCTNSTQYQIQNINNFFGSPIIYPGTGNNTITLNGAITFTWTGLQLSGTGHWNLICFDGFGTPYIDCYSSPGTPLTSAGTITLSAPNTTSRTITITPVTGYAYIT